MWHSQIGRDRVHGGIHQSFVGFCRRQGVLFLGGIPHPIWSGSSFVGTLAEVPEVALEEAILQTSSEFAVELMLSWFQIDLA